MHRAVGTALIASAALIVSGSAAQAAAGPHAAHQVIVKYAPGTSPSLRDSLADAAGIVERVGSVAGVGAQVVRVSR